jgi:peptidyl-dipeptidase A
MRQGTGCGLRAASQIALAALALAGCARQAATPDVASGAKPDADEFVAQVNAELKPILREVAAADWTQATDITIDTQLLSARANDRYLEFLGDKTEKSKAYADAPGTPATKRSLMLLKLQTSAPAPSDPAKRAELTEILASLGAMYGEAKFCPAGPDSCRNLDQLSETLATSRDYTALTDAWVGWHDTARPMRAKYQRFVELANEGAREFGFADLGAMWRSGYDMPPDEFAAETARLWGQVKPLYNEMQCYARGRLAQRYGEDKVPAGKPIPAQLLGNMWAQTWNKVYDDILKPYPNASIESADRELAKQKWDAVRMTKSAETFYTSIGFPTLPQTFWERSMLVRPRDREVVCHASAWDMDDANDVRIKMCMQPNEEDLFTIYHELGHVYYYLWYKDQPPLFQNGAHDGFHEAIGDTVNLSVTPQYLHRIGLVSAVQPSREAVINQQMKMASEKIAFLPFGKVIDEWRWKVFAGEIKPEHYNEAWWKLRTEYQGVAPPVARTEADFDPGAKYHVPGNTPYTRYFLSFIIQFQFQKALCAAAGFKGPLHECSIFGNKAAGEKFAAMLKLGQSEPWQDTMEKLTGTRQMDASAILEYFQPLQQWLTEQNRGQICGW